MFLWPFHRSFFRFRNLFSSTPSSAPMKEPIPLILFILPGFRTCQLMNSVQNSLIKQRRNQRGLWFFNMCLFSFYFIQPTFCWLKKCQRKFSAFSLALKKNIASYLLWLRKSDLIAAGINYKVYIAFNILSVVSLMWSQYITEGRLLYLLVQVYLHSSIVWWYCRWTIQKP